MRDVTGECMSGGRHWRMYEWGTSLENVRMADVTGECTSGGRHRRRHEWGTSPEKA